jgi:hypothetical protein
MGPLPAPERSTHPVDVGQRTEAAIVHLFLRRGYQVLVPCGVNQRYDLVLDLGDRFLRVQCKTGRYRDGSVLFNTRSIRSNRRGNFTRGYDGEIDMFAVYCPELDRFYVVPVEVAGRSLGMLRVDPAMNNQKRGIRWAADFELPA